MVGPLLALLVDVHLEEGDVEEAARIAQRLDLVATAQRGPYLKAAAALAKGRICIASGEGDARTCLHAALAGFARAQLPMELALQQLLAAIHGNQGAMDGFARVFAGVTSPAEFFAEENVGRIMTQAAAAAPA